jgi:N-acetylmuramoyl-L-alanine amidase
MARYPRATWRPLPEATSEPLIDASQVILHTAVSNANSLYGYFAAEKVTLESHFYVNESAVEQYIDTSRQADANRYANVRAISIETWDGGDPNHVPWTPRQLDLLVDLVAWSCRTHGIPARQCTSPTAPGIGWHSMWGAPSDWTPAKGKTCPGPLRIAQIPEIIRRVQAALGAPAPVSEVPEEDDDMAYLLISAPSRPTALLVAGRSFAKLRDTSSVNSLKTAGVEQASLSTVDYDSIERAMAATEVRLLEG